VIDPSSGIVSYLELLTGRVETPVQYENESMGKFDVKEGPSNQWGIRRGLSIPRTLYRQLPNVGSAKVGSLLVWASALEAHTVAFLMCNVVHLGTRARL